MTSADGRLFMQAACCGFPAGAALILGAPGRGKSRLSAEMAALGAVLVSDDGVWLSQRGLSVFAEPPPQGPSAIEARGVGLMPGPRLRSAPVRIVVDLDQASGERSPPRRMRRLLDASVPLILSADGLTAAVVVAALRHGGPSDPDA